MDIISTRDCRVHGRTMAKTGKFSNSMSTCQCGRVIIAICIQAGGVRAVSKRTFYVSKRTFFHAAYHVMFGGR